MLSRRLVCEVIGNPQPQTSLRMDSQTPHYKLLIPVEPFSKLTQTAFEDVHTAFLVSKYLPILLTFNNFPVWQSEAGHRKQQTEKDVGQHGFKPASSTNRLKLQLVQHPQILQVP